MKRIATFIIALCMMLAASTALGGSSARASGAPALWKVKGPTATVYIFGTIHVMKPGVSWMTPTISQALAQSRDIWLELPNSPLDVDPSDLLTRLASYGLDPQHPLSTKISHADLMRVDALAREGGIDGGEASLERFRPWLVAFMIGSISGHKTNYSASLGIDETLRAKMVDAGKPIYGFETIDQQLHFLANLPPDEEIKFFHQSLNGEGTDIDTLATMWRNGQIDQVAQVEAASNATDPGFTKVILLTRNANWARQLDIRLHGHGTSFVAVGMAHLAGKGSLLDDLTKLGYTPVRVE